AVKTEGVIKPIEQTVTDKDKNTSQQQDKVSRKTTAKRNPTNAQTSLPRTGERNTTWLYNLGIAWLLVILTRF
ncbi:LPXTG cell wall anchor domain-containing protein, partial [Enterococcus faecalis]